MKKTLYKIALFIDKLSEYSGLIFGFLIFPMIFSIVYSVIMRYFFSNSPGWAYEIPIFVYGMEVMMGGAYVLLKDAHVAVDLLPRKAKGNFKKTVDVLICLIIIVSCVFIVVIGSRFAYQSSLIRERSPFQTTWNPQIWWFRWVIPVSAALVILQGLSRLIHIFIDTNTDKEELQEKEMGEQ